MTVLSGLLTSFVGGQSIYVKGFIERPKGMGKDAIPFFGYIAN
jgi:hypothetical protein